MAANPLAAHTNPAPPARVQGPQFAGWVAPPGLQAYLNQRGIAGPPAAPHSAMVIQPLEPGRQILIDNLSAEDKRTVVMSHHTQGFLQSAHLNKTRIVPGVHCVEDILGSPTLFADVEDNDGRDAHNIIVQWMVNTEYHPGGITYADAWEDMMRNIFFFMARDVPDDIANDATLTGGANGSKIRQRHMFDQMKIAVSIVAFFARGRSLPVCATWSLLELRERQPDVWTYFVKPALYLIISRFDTYAEGQQNNLQRIGAMALFNVASFCKILKSKLTPSNNAFAGVWSVEGVRVLQQNMRGGGFPLPTRDTCKGVEFGVAKFAQFFIAGTNTVFPRPLAAGVPGPQGSQFMHGLLPAQFADMANYTPLSPDVVNQAVDRDENVDLM